MTISLLAGKPAPKEMLVDLSRLEREYFERRPDLDDPNQLVVFGTSGHRGSPLHGSFTEAHILAIPQATCDWPPRSPPGPAKTQASTTMR
jgi:phosphoglucomutase